MNQRGFTLLELLVVMGVLGVLAPILAVTVRQIVVQSSRDTTRITAQVAVEDTGRTLGQDIPLAQATSLTVVGSPVTLTNVVTFSVEWTDWAIPVSPTVGPGTPTPTPIPFDTYSQSAAKYPRVRVTYSLVGSDLKRKVESCSDWNLTAVPPSCTGTWNTTSNATAARKVASITFKRLDDPDPLSKDPVFTVTVTSSPKGPGFPTADRTFTIYGALIGSGSPV